MKTKERMFHLLESVFPNRHTYLGVAGFNRASREDLILHDFLATIDMPPSGHV
jgi:hypothetical protein